MDTFSIDCGVSDAGWCRFSVTVAGQTHACSASWLGGHPVCELLQIAVHAHQHYFIEAYRDEPATETLDVQDEPGGIRVVFRFLRDQVLRMTITQLTEGILRPDPEYIRSEPYFDGFVTLRNLMSEAYAAAARLLREQGITGTRMRWLGWRWDLDGPECVFPVDHFIYVSEFMETQGQVGFSQSTIERDLWHLQKALKKT